MDEIYKKFLEYNFDNSPEFKEFSEKFQKEENETTEDYRKRFYKSHICREFDVNYRPHQANNQRNRTQRRNNPRNSPPLFEIIDYSIIVLSFMALLISIPGFLAFSFIYYIYRLYFSVGWIRFNTDYLQNVIHNNNFGLLVLSFMSLVTKTKNISIILPIISNQVLYIVSGVNKYWTCSFFEKIISNNSKINNLAEYLEIFNIISSIIGFFVGVNKFFFIFFYLQYLKFRYYASDEIRNKIQNLRIKMEEMKNNSNNPILSSVMGVILKICEFFSKGIIGGSNFVMVSGGVMCNIF